jgi:hypothetical protein
MGGLWRRAIFVRVADVLVEGRGLGGCLSFLFLRRLGGTKRRRLPRGESGFVASLHLWTVARFRHGLFGRRARAALALCLCPRFGRGKIFPVRGFFSEIMSPCRPCISASAGMCSSAAPAMAVTSTNSPRCTWNGSIRSRRKTGNPMRMARRGMRPITSSRLRAMSLRRGKSS